MITKKQILKLGFIPNPDYQHPAFDEWIHKDFPYFGIGDYNGEGVLIEGIDWHEPIDSYHDLQLIVKVLTSRSTQTQRARRFFGKLLRLVGPLG